MKKDFKGEEITPEEMMKKYNYKNSLFVGWDREKKAMGIIIEPACSLTEINLICSEIIGKNCVRVIEYEQEIHNKTYKEENKKWE